MLTSVRVQFFISRDFNVNLVQSDDKCVITN